MRAIRKDVRPAVVARGGQRAIVGPGQWGQFYLGVDREECVFTDGPVG